jgi:FMN phosphatase YigB (HAD superfamily)
MAKSIVVFDLDGTLADNQHRVHYLHETPKNWDAFFAAQADDKPRQDVVRVSRLFSTGTGIEIFILTGRPETYRSQTEGWLRHHNIPYDKLVMRGADDRTDDHILKRQHLQDWIDTGHNICGFFDDRKRICDAAREMGLTVFQMAEGDF